MTDDAIKPARKVGIIGHVSHGKSQLAALAAVMLGSRAVSVTLESMGDAISGAQVEQVIVDDPVVDEIPAPTKSAPRRSTRAWRRKIEAKTRPKKVRH